ncbi:MAG TPA: hypothetical protein VJ719_13740 [Chthoniobacterales bacterium]|nr:hypothetical protein [Chthoniobacterales bacterium]
MTASEALEWVEKCGIAVESARVSLPNLVQLITGEPPRGSWWGHPRADQILRLSRAIRRSPDVLVCRLVNGKITYVHRRMWPALVALAGRFPKERLAALKEVHLPSGNHKVLVTLFPQWVPNDVRRAATKLPRKAISQLEALLRDAK